MPLILLGSLHQALEEHAGSIEFSWMMQMHLGRLKLLREQLAAFCAE
jgi:hypothetical protein